MKIFSKKNITVSLIALVIGVSAVFGVAKIFRQSTTSVTGNITAFILSPEGKVDGAVLDTGGQINFGMETGEIVTGQVKIGDTLTATGHAGTKSDYGRELRSESLQIGDQTITVLHSKPRPPRDGDKPKLPRPGDERGPKPRPEAGKMPPLADDPKDADAPKPDDANALNVPPPAPMPTATVSGQVKIVLVGGRGEARGLILDSGEQIALPKEVNDSSLTFDQQTKVNAEGEAMQTDFGIFIRPTRLSIGNQTFSFNR